MPDWNATLAELSELPGVTGAAIVSRDGIPVAAALPSGAFAESLCAMAAAGFAAFETAADDVIGAASSTILSAARGHLIVHGGHPDVLYVLVSAPDADARALTTRLEERASAPAR